MRHGFALKLGLKFAGASGLRRHDLGGGFGNSASVTKLALAVAAHLFGGSHRPLANRRSAHGVLLFGNRAMLPNERRQLSPSRLRLLGEIVEHGLVRS